MIMETSTAGEIQSFPNPLLLEDLLDKVFPYFENDVKNLGSFRLVNKTWNKSASRFVKKSLRWKIEAGQENEFVEVMTNTKDDLFRNFNIANPPWSNTFGLNFRNVNSWMALQTFLKLFGHFVTDLKCSPHEIHRVSVTALLPNLEYLQVYSITQINNATGLKLTATDFLEVDFPKLKNISFLLGSSRNIGWNSDIFSNICCQILKNTFQVNCLEIVVPELARKVLADVNLDQLTSFVSKLYTSPLTSKNIQDIQIKCPNLTIFSAFLVASAEITTHKMISKFSHQMKELNLEIVERGDDGENNPENRDVSDHDNELEGVEFRRKVPRLAFPSCPKLKKLTLRNWQLFNGNDFNINLPSLTYVDLNLSSLNLPLVGPQHGHRNVSYLKFRSVNVNEATVTSLAVVFPHVTELDIELENDEALHAIYNTMPQLNRLHLCQGKVTDTGITGIPVDELARLRCLSVEEYAEVDVPSIRRYSFIGDLNYLQHFTLEERSLSKLSVYFGFISLRELTYLKVPPYYHRGDSYVFTEKVHVRALADHCSTLVRLDVNGFLETNTSSDSDDVISQPPPEFKGCGLTNEDIEYVIMKLPHLEIIYREKKSLSDMEKYSMDENDQAFY